MLSGVSTRSTRGRLSGTAASRLPQHGAPTRRNRHVIRQTKRLSGQMIRCCKPCRRHRAHQKRFNSMRRRRRILFWMQFLTVERQHPVAPSRPKLAGGCPQLPVVAGGLCDLRFVPGTIESDTIVATIPVAAAVHLGFCGRVGIRSRKPHDGEARRRALRLRSLGQKQNPLPTLDAWVKWNIHKKHEPFARERTFPPILCMSRKIQSEPRWLSLGRKLPSATRCRIKNLPARRPADLFGS
ncbi:hypothetical protein SAMN05878503_101162 [Cereibacter ovatus]|uniref:Uncharacterized protein n=1 Tax=Cereibacter ovatus TaxID=439529 RepID=A0A285CKG5_9RHOB|nr:hypothetical protein SAMN05878503_101162 [Cereibacter ovatus]